MTILEAVVLGIVQGLTEFLPISSSAHLVLVPDLLGWQQPSLPFVVLLHAATLLALIVYFRRELIRLAAGMFKPGVERRLVVLLAIATLPAAIIGYVFEKQFEESFGEPRQVAIQLIITGLILVAAERLARRADVAPGEGGEEEMAAKLNWKSALGIGLAQAVAIVPGISRSGSTIGGGLVAGLSRPAAARFSFLLSIPILFGTSVFEVPKLAADNPGGAVMAAGFLASAISGYLAIAGMIAFLQRRGLLVFAAYCVIAGGIFALIV